MKRWLATILLVAFIAGTLTVPAKAEPIGAEYWTSHQSFNSDIVGTGNGYVLSYEGSTTLHNDTPKYPMAGKFVCSATDCSKRDIYLDGYFTVNFSDEYGHAPYTLRVIYAGSETGAPVHEVDASCAGYSCNYHFFAIIPASEVSGSQSVLYHAYVTLDLDGTIGGTQNYSINLRMSYQSLSETDCSSQYESILVTSAGTIDPTKEAGETATLTPGRTYQLTVDGGPWFDSASAVDGRYDTALKIGADDWQQTEGIAATDIVNCVQNDPENTHKITFVFTATPPVDHPLDPIAFAIRVNDVAGAFLDNHSDTPMQYSLEQVQPISGYGCENQFLTGTQLATGTLDPTAEQGVKIKPTMFNLLPLSAGGWVKIVISGGPWYDDGAGFPRRDVAIKTAITGWHELSTDANGNCSLEDITGTTLTAYIQLPTADGIWLRVNDTGTNWAANTGSMSYALYSVIYSALPAGDCAEHFQLGSLINTWTVDAFNADGVNTDSWLQQANQASGVGTEGDNAVQKYLAIETSGVWYDGTFPMPTGAIVKNPNTSTSHSSWSWSLLSNFSDRSCSVVLDPMGHVRMYFPYDQSASYWLRVNDAEFNDNTGSLNFKIYKATNLQPTGYSSSESVPLGTDTCSSTYTHETSGATFTIAATNSEGLSLPVPTSGNLYAFATSAGPWLDNGTSQYGVELSADNGATWQSIRSFPGTICVQSADGNHVLVYWQGLQGRRYKVRVDDQDGYFANNSGSINLIYYQTITTVITPWTNCDTNYSMQEVSIPEANRTIPAQSSTGIPIQYIESGKTYALEIMDAYPWQQTSGGAYLYTADISANNGANWTRIGPDLDGDRYRCIVHSGGPSSPYRIYFTANGSYRLRVGDDAGTWESNVGYLEYKLYEAQEDRVNETSPGTSNDTSDRVSETIPYIPPEWAAACYETYPRPNYLIKTVSFSLGSVTFGTLGTVTFPTIALPIPAIGDWGEYLFWSIRHFFAFCPEHASAISALGSDIYNYEPFGTFKEVYTELNNFTQRMAQLTSTGGSTQSFTPYDPIFGGSTGGADGSSSGWNGILPVLDSNSPWNGGALVYNPNAAEEAAGGQQPYFDYCQATYNAHLGFSVTFGLCAVFKLSRLMGFAWILCQLAIDVSALLALVKYIKSNWIDTGASA